MTVYNDQISQYIQDTFIPQDDFLSQVPALAAAQGLPEIQITPEEGRFLQFLVSACSARKALEIGTLGGFSGIWIARGLAPDGKLITLERDAHHAQVAGQHFERAGVQQQVEIRLGNAHALLSELVAEGPFDFVFIDAEKSGYLRYLDWAIEHTRSGAIITAHNAFRYGEITNQADQSLDTRTIREINHYAANHPRLCSTIFPAGDGTLVCVKV